MPGRVRRRQLWPLAVSGCGEYFDVSQGVPMGLCCPGRSRLYGWRSSGCADDRPISHSMEASLNFSHRSSAPTKHCSTCEDHSTHAWMRRAPDTLSDIRTNRQHQCTSPMGNISWSWCNVLPMTSVISSFLVSSVSLSPAQLAECNCLEQWLRVPEHQVLSERISFPLTFVYTFHLQLLVSCAVAKTTASIYGCVRPGAGLFRRPHQRLHGQVGKPLSAPYSLHSFPG